MEKAAIFYFSGTGNTGYVAKLISKNLKGVAVDLFRIEDILNKDVSVNISDYDAIGIGSPSYGFDTPKIVDDFCKSLNEAEGMKVFLFLTCGGPCYLNDVALFGIKGILKRKGCELIYEKVFCMPANVFLKYDDYVIKRLFDSAAARAEAMAKDITENTVKVRNDRFAPYLFRWFFALLMRPGIITTAMDFKVEKTCDNCLKCVRICPRKNINLEEKIKHGLKCEVCYRCVYACPKRAIKGRLYNFVIIKDGYDIKSMLERCADAKAKPLEGIYKTLGKYLDSQV